MLSFLPTSRVLICFAACGLAVCGCDAPIDKFESNVVFAKRLELTEGVAMSQPLEDTQVVLTELFGTPNDPRWPDFLDEAGVESLVSAERLGLAAGAVSSDEQGRHRGLYREHCVVCHGVSGNGLGPTAALLNPYPRDFRLGKVKFKSTPIGIKPTKDDLARTIRRGIVGTSMPSFQVLDDNEIDALVDYVIYLSVRGELERKLLAFAATELDIESGERVVDLASRESDQQSFDEQWDLITDYAKNVVRSWRESQEVVPPVPERSMDLVLAGEKVEGATSSSNRQLTASIARGKELFQGNVASCAFCHGPEALGDGQQNNYDDWTRDWTSQAGLNPADKSQLKPMLELGALKPRTVMPRNLRRGIFRGGASPEDLYTRIVNGIEGTPMPAAPLKPDNPQGLTEGEVWDIVNYLLSLSAQVDKAESKLETPAHG